MWRLPHRWRNRLSTVSLVVANRRETPHPQQLASSGPACVTGGAIFIDAPRSGSSGRRHRRGNSIIDIRGLAIMMARREQCASELRLCHSDAVQCDGALATANVSTIVTA
jgi:hypothetical protein